MNKNGLGSFMHQVDFGRVTIYLTRLRQNTTQTEPIH